MGSVSLKIGDGTVHLRRRSNLYSSLLYLLMLASVVATNLFAFYSSPAGKMPFIDASDRTISGIMREIELSQQRLRRLERDSLAASGLHILGITAPDLAKLPPELAMFLSPHPLPLGPDSRSGLTSMLSSIPHPCFRSPSAFSLLSLYSSYSPHSPCPVTNDSFLLPHKLISKACDPLPRQRCLARHLQNRTFTQNPSRSLWPAAPGVNRNLWMKPRWKNDFLIDDVLSISGGASKIRIGFDISGGAGNFAARMAEHNVRIVSSVLDSGGKPVNDIVASRRLFPLLLSPAHRFPFYDGVFDLVHVAAALDEGGAPAMGRAGQLEALEFFMFDIDRILRVGGVLWIDNYKCINDERRRAIAKLIDRFRYKKLKWVLGEKQEDGKMQIYMSAVLQKPARI